MGDGGQAVPAGLEPVANWRAAPGRRGTQSTPGGPQASQARRAPSGDHDDSGHRRPQQARRASWRGSHRSADDQRRRCSTRKRLGAALEALDSSSSAMRPISVRGWWIVVSDSGAARPGRCCRSRRWRRRRARGPRTPPGGRGRRRRSRSLAPKTAVGSASRRSSRAAPRTPRLLGEVAGAPPQAAEARARPSSAR